MAIILSQNWLISRRYVLLGLGVSLPLPLPLLGCMRPLLAAEKAVRPKRSVFVYLPVENFAASLGAVSEVTA